MMHSTRALLTEQNIFVAPNYTDICEFVGEKRRKKKLSVKSCLDYTRSTVVIPGTSYSHVPENLIM